MPLRAAREKLNTALNLENVEKANEEEKKPKKRLMAAPTKAELSRQVAELSRENEEYLRENERLRRLIKDHGIEDAEVATEGVKKEVKSGAITVKKASERQTFKREKDAKNHAVNENNESNEETDRVVFVKGPTLCIRGYDLVAETLHSAFEKYGTIEKLTVDDRKKSAHITFISVEEAELAVNEMNGNLLNGMTVRCSFARENLPLNPNTSVDNDSESILKSGATFRIPKKKRSEEVGDFSSPMQRQDDRKFGSSANTAPSSSFGNDNDGNYGRGHGSARIFRDVRGGRSFRSGDRGFKGGNRGTGGFHPRGINHGNRTASPNISGSGFGSSGFGSSPFGDTNFGNDLKLSTDETTAPTFRLFSGVNDPGLDDVVIPEYPDDCEKFENL